MRVTNKMMSNQVICNLNRSLEHFMRLQEKMSTGRKINRPSDDPIGTQKDLRYRTALNEIMQFKRNIISGTSLLATYDYTLGSMKDMISSANELAISLSNDTYDETARIGAANEIESLFDQLISLANTKLEGRYIFSGHRTRSATLEATSLGVTYLGDGGYTEIEVESGSKVGVNLIGSEVLFQQFCVLGEEADLNVGVNGDTLLADLRLGEGIDLISGLNPGQFILTDNNRDPADPAHSVIIDISAATTLEEARTMINNQLSLAGLTDVSVDYGTNGNNLRWIANDNGRVSRGTPLHNLNSGSGVDLTEGKLRFHNDDYSVDFEVVLNDPQSLGDVIDDINNDPNIIALGISVDINIMETGLAFIDPLPLENISVEEVTHSSTTAADLGILGSVDAAYSVGDDLNPQSDYSATEANSDQTVLADLGILGDFSNLLIGEDLNPLITLDSPVMLLENGIGAELGQIQIAQGNRSATLNLGNPAYVTVADLLDAINGCGLDIEASINEAGTGIQIVPTINTATLIISEVSGGNTAHQMGINGSPDILGSLMVLEDAFRNNMGEDARQIIGNLYDGIDQLLNQRAMVGSKVIGMESASARLLNIEFEFTKLLSEVEDADLTKLVSDLAMRENSYQAALIAAARIIQPSLLNFLK